MQIEVKLDRNLPVQLPAVGILEATKNQVQALPQEGLRHPLGTYNVSVDIVISAATRVLDELEKAFPLEGEEAAERVIQSDNLRNATRQFLLANGEHVDACEKILKCYFVSDSKDKYAKAKRDLRSNLAWYDRHIMAQANHLKHRHSQVRNLCLYTSLLAVPGYFIESSISAEVVGPDPVVHRGSNSAFSYARQLRIFLCGLFYVSRTLSTLLSSRGRVSCTTTSSSTSGLATLIERVASFSNAMLPDEYEQPYAEVRCSKSFFLLRFGNSISARAPYGEVHFKIALGGDGVTRSFQLPYLKS